MRYISLIFLLFIATSCGRDWCYERYPMPEVDSVRITQGLDTLYIPMPADTVFIQSDIDCPDQRIIYKDGKIEYKIQIKDRILTVYRISKVDSLAVITRFMNSEEFKRLTQQVKVIEPVVKWPKFLWYSIGANLLLIIWVTRNIWMRFIKFPI